MNKPLNSFFSEIKAIPPILQSAYYPSLNGLRGIAILLVVLDHLNLASGSFYHVIFNGELGVLIFFVLSGFLITTLCIKEKVTNKDISLKHFYLRRALRIFPVAYLFILVIIILNYVYKLHISYINLLGTAFYLMNISSFFRKYYFSWHTAHFWSLSVEEQFYLIIPFILKKRFKIYLLTIVFIVFVLPIIICLQNLYPLFNITILYALTHYLIKFQAIAVGCLFSVLIFKYSFKQKELAKFKVVTNLLAILLIFYIQYNNFFSIRSMLAGLVISVLVGYIVVTNISPANDFIFRLLNIKFLNVIGVLSYSIYIWQQIFTSNDSRLPNFMVTYPYNIGCIIVISGLSYYLYESYFLKVKLRFSKIKRSKPIAVE